MPLVLSAAIGQSDGDEVTEFTDTTGTAATTWSYPEAQNVIRVWNKGNKDITVTVGAFANQVVKPGEMFLKRVGFLSFSTQSTSGTQHIRVQTISKGIPDGIRNIKEYRNYAIPSKGLVTDWSPAYVEAFTELNLSEAALEVPFGSQKHLSNLSVPAKFELSGKGKPTLDFSTAPDGISCVTMLNEAHMEDIVIKGRGKTSTQIGLNINGTNVKPSRVDITDVGTGVFMANENTYINTLEKTRIYNAGICVNVDLATAGTTNSGEKVILEDCEFFNSNQGIMCSGSTLDMYIKSCSFDYMLDFGDMNNGQYKYDTCHFETDLARTPQGYLFRKRNGAQVAFVNCRFGFDDFSFVIDQATEGTSGSVRYIGCEAHFKPTGGGASIVVSSEMDIFFAAGETTKTFDTPFISRTAKPSISIAGHTGNPIRSVTLPTVTFSANSTLGTITFGGPVAANTIVRISFG